MKWRTRSDNRLATNAGGAGTGGGQTIQTTPGAREYAAGDRIMFLRNEKSLGVKNGTLGQWNELAASPCRPHIISGHMGEFPGKRQQMHHQIILDRALGAQRPERSFLADRIPEPNRRERVG